MDKYYKILLDYEYIGTVKAIDYDIFDEFGSPMYTIKFLDAQHKYIVEFDSYMWRPQVTKEKDIDNTEIFNVHIFKKE